MVKEDLPRASRHLSANTTFEPFKRKDQFVSFNPIGKIQLRLFPPQA